ncbi:hypothetical protein Tco_0316806 [Tanacetum coccineum]
MLIEKKGYLLITKERRESCALICLSDLTGKMQGFEVIVGNANMEHTIIPSTEAKSRKDGVTRSIAPTRDGRIFSGLVELVVSGDGEAVEMVVKHCGCSDEGVLWG